MARSLLASPPEGNAAAVAASWVTKTKSEETNMQDRTSTRSQFFGCKRMVEMKRKNSKGLGSDVDNWRCRNTLDTPYKNREGYATS